MTNDGAAGPAIAVTPERPRFDERVAIELAGFPPDEAVTLTARQRLADGVWASEATFRTDGRGRVDVADAAPESGTYEGADAMGLFWSMEREATVPRPRPYVEDRAVVPAEVTASVGGRTVASRVVERTLVADGVTHEAVEPGDLVGECYLPAETPAPPVVLLGGSRGGRPPRVPATLLASEGYAVLALAYFGCEGRPPTLERIPLEYFDRAVERFRDRDAVRPGPVGVVGWSRGAELALLLGTRIPSLRTVVAYAPSGVVFESPAHAHTSPWSADGDPVPYVPVRYPVRPHALWRRLQRRPVDLTPAYRRSYEQAAGETVADATIPVEEVGGPVLLVSGGDDRMWPAARFAADVVERLDARDYPHRYVHLSYEDAGHGIGAPYDVTTERRTGPTFLFGRPFDLGGTPAGYAGADADAWTRALSFLDEGLRDAPG